MPKQQRRGRLAATVELTPLIDIVFLLLIFFMVSATWVRRSQLEIELPQANGAPPVREGVAVQVAVHRDGRYEVNGEPAGAGQLQAALAALRTTDDGGAVVVAADAEASHQAVVTALQAAGKAGLTRISILTRSPEPE